MTRHEVFNAIQAILTGPMAHTRMHDFSLQARLNEDLYLDSVLMLQIFLNLELEYGLEMPEEAIASQDVNTVDDLISLYVPKSETPSFALTGGEADEGVHGEAYYDIKVHCFVSCVCDGLKKQGIDHRPFYFGVWDAKFTLSEDYQLQYHSQDVTQHFFRDWFQRLYRVPVREWYDFAKSKQENLETLISLVNERSDTGSVMVMLDMFHLPERENKFNQNPFPHYLMLQNSSDPAKWFVHDPDYRWEGEIEREKVVHAIMQPTVAGGYVFDAARASEAQPEDIAAYFEACFIAKRNPIVDSTRDIIKAHLEGRNGLKLADLALAVRELPVVTIRKYAYEHGFAFFWRALKLPASEFEMWCEEIEALIQSLKNLHYACMKLSQTGDHEQANAVYEKLEEADRLERKIKTRLSEVYEIWHGQNLLIELSHMRRAGGQRGW